MARPGRRPRVLLVSPTVPFDGVPHAGGRYLLSLCRLLERDTELTVLVPGTRVNTDSATRRGAPSRLVAVGGRPGRTLVRRALGRAAVDGDRRLRRFNPGMVYLPMVAGILTTPEVRRLVRDADVVDLQWSDSIRLARLVRWLNPHARILGTFHDVQSQLFAREPADSARGRLFWRLVARRARWTERHDVRLLDEVLVFSDKDARLLGRPRHARVVHPPLAGTPVPAAPPTSDSTVLFVSYLARDENDQAARWFLREIWPLVTGQVPGARLRIVGSGASAVVLDLVAADESVTAVGFVDDLDAEYAAARVCVVPLRQGAGVKFKTIEALLHGVPVVTTTVGAEGIEGPDLFVAVADTPRPLAGALARALTEPESQRARSEAARAWAQASYGQEHFEAAIRASLGPALGPAG